MPVIDFHSHMIETSLLEVCGNHSVQTGFGARPFPKPDDPSGKGKTYAKMARPDAHIEFMDANGIDATVVTLSTVLQNIWWAPAKRATEMARQVNETVARWVSEHPHRFIGSLVLPLQDIELALRELEFAADSLGLTVVNMPANVNGHYVGEPMFHPLWQQIEARQLTSFLHPHGVADPWFQNYRMWNSIGQSIEEVKAMTSLIYEGVMDKFPQLKIVMAHGGGYFPHYMGRLDRNVHNYPESTRNISAKPSDYLSRFYYDTCVYDPAVVDALVRIVGVDRLVMGSDYPVGEPDPVAFLRRCPSLTDHDIARVSGTTAAELLQYSTANK